MVRVSKLELSRTITEILMKGNLQELTTKIIRTICEQKYNVDLTSRKQEIDAIVMSFVKKASQTDQGGNETHNKVVIEESASDKAVMKESSTSYESHDGSSCSSRSGSESCSDSECSYSESSEEETNSKSEASKQMSMKIVPKKRPMKKSVTQGTRRSVTTKSSQKGTRSPPAKILKKNNAAKQTEVDDAAYARKLQAEEWNFRQRTVKKLFRNTKKKSDKTEEPKRKKACPFMKKCLLSPALAEVIGTNEMSRPDIVQKMWSVVRERNLFDAANKQYVLCDEQLMKVFGKKRVRLIGMMKYLKHHIKDIN